jgi:aryl-alcohol dehydrogenase-like predicted oxidoreductase
MERRSLGNSGYEISRIGLGTWAIGGHMWGGQDDAHSVEAIHAAVDHGVNWVATAPISLDVTDCPGVDLRTTP